MKYHFAYAKKASVNGGFWAVVADENGLETTLPVKCAGPTSAEVYANDFIRAFGKDVNLGPSNVIQDAISRATNALLETRASDWKNDEKFWRLSSCYWLLRAASECADGAGYEEVVDMMDHAREALVEIDLYNAGKE